MIDKRLLSQELYQEDEWNEIIKKAVFPSEKARKKISKDEAKEEEEIDKTFSKKKHGGDFEEFDIVTPTGYFFNLRFC